MDLSIIVISYNTAQVTKNCLESVEKSLKNSHLTYEIIVIDNASTDDSVKVLKQYKPIENKENIGFGRANNQGVKLAKGKYILLLNSDTLVLENAIDRLYQFITTHQEADFVGAKLLNKDLSSQPSCGPYYSLPVVFGALFLKGDYWGLTRQSPDKTVQTDWISGACIMTKKEIFEKLGGFDEDIFMYMEEIDLFYRARQKGMKIYFYPEAQIVHLGSISSGGRTYPILQVYKGFLYLYRKHHSGLSLFCLRIMLQLKSLIAVYTGRITKNEYLIKTYEEARSLAK